MAPLIGKVLNGRFRLDARVGTGGMSTVYRAFDQVLERPVAIKLLARHIATDSDQIERFRREARAVAQLSHPHIVTVIDAGEAIPPGYPTEPDHEDVTWPYIVFEYVEGETLKERIRRLGRLPVAEAVAYAIEIARALAAAHQRSIVHRDVKPQNVLIDAEGSAKVTDFGIARSLDEEGLTADGRVLGTTDYVSPEQALGHDVTGQSDLYSLGIVLYEMLTGEVPFRGENQVAVAMKHVREELPDVQVRCPEVSAALASVVEHATAKPLNRRYVHDEDLIADLEDALAIETARHGAATGEATTVLRTLPRRARRRLPLRMRHPAWLAGGLALVLAVAAVAAVGLSQQAQRGTGTSGASRPPGKQSFSLRQDAASDFDPLGDREEHSRETAGAVDRDPTTSWSSERYEGGLAGKLGVGLLVDASPGVAAKAIEMASPEGGWTYEVYAAREATVPEQAPNPESDGVGAWTRLSAPVDYAPDGGPVDLDTASQPFRHYLIWITRLPPSGQVRVAEVYLFR